MFSYSLRVQSTPAPEKPLKKRFLLSSSRLLCDRNIYANQKPPATPSTPTLFFIPEKVSSILIQIPSAMIIPHYRFRLFVYAHYRTGCQLSEKPKG